MNLTTTDFKRNSSGRTQIHEYIHPIHTHTYIHTKNLFRHAGLKNSGLFP